MPDTASVDASDRLPWLSDTPRTVEAPARKQRSKTAGTQGLAGWAVAAVLLVAGGSYWLGTKTAAPPESAQVQTSPGSTPETTLTLPEAFAPDQPEVPMTAAPEVSPAPAPVVTIPSSVTRPARRERRPRLTREEPPTANLEETVGAQTAASESTEAKVAAAPPPVVAKPQPPKLWPSRQVKGAAGRLVQIGAFGSRQQAKLGWRRMQRAYPAVGRLPAVVVESRNSRGRRFYRFQIGTTSQAHSEILCQRMQRIDFSCAVLGLPWKSKVER